jgi:hypothetical protein
VIGNEARRRRELADVSNEIDGVAGPRGEEITRARNEHLLGWPKPNTRRTR